MSDPEGPIAIECGDKPEVLKPGYKVLLGGPSFLVAFAYQQDPEMPGAQFNQDLLMGLLAEYAAIYETIANLVGIQNMIVMETEFIRIAGQKVVREQLPSDIRAGFNTRVFPYFEQHWRCWPKNAFVVIEGEIFMAKGAVINRYADSVNERWGIGDGGMVEYEGGVALVVEATPQDEIDDLLARGIKVLLLPQVDPNKQPFEFREKDIDGHARLIKTQSGQLKLYIAKSYIIQSKGFRREMIARTQAVGVELEVIDDRRLPPLGLNFIKLHFGHVIVSGPNNNLLAQKLRNDLGHKKVHTTPLPITSIPTRATGSLGCLTNLLPPGVLQI